MNSDKLVIPLKGRSMEPYLYEGDILHFIACKKEELKIGDVALFHENDELVSHRLIKYKGHRYFKGDFSQVLSSYNQNVFAKLNKVEREEDLRTFKASRISSFLSSQNQKKYFILYRKFFQTLNFIFSKIQMK